MPRALRRDVLVVQPSIEPDSVELIGAAVDGRWMIQRTRRNGADLAVHARRLMTFFSGARRTSNAERTNVEPTTTLGLLAPLVFSWLAGRGATATRLDPHDVALGAAAAGAARRAARRRRLFVERLDQR